MRHLLDTSALLAHYRKEAGGAAVQSLFEDEEIVIVIASITIAEFARRMRELGADEPSVTESLSFYISMMEEIVAVDASIAWESDRLQRGMPERLPLADALIAACAINKEAVLVHRDSHMRTIPVEFLKQLDLGSNAS